MQLMAVEDRDRAGRGSAQRLMRVVRIDDLAEGIKGFVLTPSDGLALPPVDPGSHLEIVIGAGIVRSYSLITPDCDVNRYSIAVQREAGGRGGSKWLHDTVRPGAELLAGAPRNHFGLDARSGPVALFAGGIGITPIYSMFDALLARGRDVQLHYWHRAPGQALFRDRLSGHPQAALHATAAGGRPCPSLAELIAGLAPGTAVYGCGPPRMLAELEHLIDARPALTLHVERFVPAAAPEMSGKAEFIVELARSKRRIGVLEGQTVLAALVHASVDVPYSCEEGLCGACETRVLGGRPLHRDSVRSAEEHRRRATMMVCCSGSLDDCLVLDL